MTHCFCESFETCTVVLIYVYLIQKTQFLGLHKPTDFGLSLYEPINITPALIILIFVLAQIRVAVDNLGIMCCSVPMYISLFHNLRYVHKLKAVKQEPAHSGSFTFL